MSRLWNFRVAVILVLFLVTANAASAHRMHAGLTTVKFMTNSQEVQITHRLYVHDLEPLIREELDHGWQDDEATSQLVGAYSGERFALAFGSKLTELDYVGAETEAEFVYLYFTAQAPEKWDTIVVWSTILMDRFPEQVNLTNIYVEEDTYSAMLRAGHTTKTLALGDG